MTAKEKPPFRGFIIIYGFRFKNSSYFESFDTLVNAQLKKLLKLFLVAESSVELDLAILRIRSGI